MVWQTRPSLSKYSHRPPLGSTAPMGMLQRSPLGRWSPSVPSLQTKGVPSSPALGFRRNPLVYPSDSSPQSRRALWAQTLDLSGVKVSSTSDRPSDSTPLQSRPSVDASAPAPTPESNSMPAPAVPAPALEELSSASSPKLTPPSSGDNASDLPPTTSLQRKAADSTDSAIPDLPTLPLATRHQSPLGSFRMTPPRVQQAAIAPPSGSADEPVQRKTTGTASIEGSLAPSETREPVTQSFANADPETIARQETPSEPPSSPSQSTAPSAIPPSEEQPHTPSTFAFGRQGTSSLPETTETPLYSALTFDEGETTLPTIEVQRQSIPDVVPPEVLSVTETPDPAEDVDSPADEPDMPSAIAPLEVQRQPASTFEEQTTAEEPEALSIENRTAVQRQSGPTDSPENPAIAVPQQSIPTADRQESLPRPALSEVQPQALTGNQPETPSATGKTAIQPQSEPTLDSQEPQSDSEATAIARRQPDLTDDAPIAVSDLSAVEVSQGSTPAAEESEAPSTTDSQTVQRPTVQQLPDTTADLQETRSISETAPVQRQPEPAPREPETLPLSEPAVIDSQSPSTVPNSDPETSLEISSAVETTTVQRQLDLTDNALEAPSISGISTVRPSDVPESPSNPGTVMQQQPEITTDAPETPSFSETNSEADLVQRQPASATSIDETLATFDPPEVQPSVLAADISESSSTSDVSEVQRQPLPADDNRDIPSLSNGAPTQPHPDSITKSQESSSNLESAQIQRWTESAIARHDAETISETPATPHPVHPDTDSQKTPSAINTPEIQQRQDSSIDEHSMSIAMDMSEVRRFPAADNNGPETQSIPDTDEVQSQADLPASREALPEINPMATAQPANTSTADEQDDQSIANSTIDVRRQPEPSLKEQDVPFSQNSSTVQRQPTPTVDEPKTASVNDGSEISVQTAPNSPSRATPPTSDTWPSATPAPEQPITMPATEMTPTSPSIAASQDEQSTASEPASHLRSQQTEKIQEFVSPRVEEPPGQYQAAIQRYSSTHPVPTPHEPDDAQKPPLGWRFLQPLKSSTAANQALTQESGESDIHLKGIEDPTVSEQMTPQSRSRTLSPTAIPRKTSDSSSSEPWQQQFQLQAKRSQPITEPWQSQFNLEPHAAPIASKSAQATPDPISTTSASSAPEADTEDAAHQEQDSAPVIQLRSPLSPQTSTPSDSAASEVTDAQIEELARLCYRALRSRLSQERESYFGVSDQSSPWLPVAVSPTHGQEQALGDRPMETSQTDAVTLQQDPKIQAFVNVVNALVRYRLQTDRERSGMF